MSTLYWKGSAPAIAGVKEWKFTTAGTIGDIITVTIGSKSYAYATTSATIATFLPLLATALNALSSSVYPEFAEITWGSTSSTLTATDDTPGKPSIVNVSTNSGSTTINSGTITDATNATPVVITSTAHGLASGSVVTIASVGGNTNANGTWIITVVSANTFSLNGSAGNSAYTSGGTWTAPTGSTTTVSSGPKSVRTAANYSSGAVPATGDTLIIDLEGARLLYDLEFFSSAYGNAIVLAARKILAKDLEIGLPITNSDGTPYTEYRQTYWQQTATLDYVNTDSGLIRLDHLTGQTTYEQDNSGSGSEAEVPAVLLKGTHSSNVFNIFGGEFGLAKHGGAASTANVLRADDGATVFCGSGCTLNTINNHGADITINSAVVTALNSLSPSAKTTICGSGAVAQLNAYDGLIDYQTSGTLGGNTVLGGGAILTFENDTQTRTVTNPIEVQSNQVQILDQFVSCGTLIMDFNFCQPGTLGLGRNVRVTRGAVA